VSTKPSRRIYEYGIYTYIRYIELAKQHQEDGEREFRWGSMVTEKQKKLSNIGENGAILFSTKGLH
jgi:hypothetical protein